MFTTYNLLLLAEESVTLQGLIELVLRDVREDLILSFISSAVRDSENENAGNVFFPLTFFFFFFKLEGCMQNKKSALAAGLHSYL